MERIKIIDTADIYRIIKPERIKTVVDLGCHRGEHIQKQIRKRFKNAEILGIEPKESNFRECVALNLEGVKFAQLDCRKLTREDVGTFDFVWCYGLIYHLDDPTLLMKSICEITTDDSFTWIEGHIAIETEQAQMTDPNPEIVRKVLDGEPYYGKMYREFKPDTPAEQKDLADKASLDNEYAFWLTYDSMVRMFRKYNFQSVAETASRTWGPGIYIKDLKREWSRYGFLLSKKAGAF